MKTIFILLVVLVVGGVWYIGFGKKDAEAPGDSDVARVNTDNMDSAILVDGEYAVDVGASELNWEGKKKFVPGYYDRGVVMVQSGSFTVSSGKITSGEIIVDMNSIGVKSTGRGSDESRLTNHLKSADFFDAAQFPTAKFELAEIIPVSGSDYTVQGSLTIKGITKPISFPVKINAVKGDITAEGAVVIDRSLWNVRYGSESFFDNLGDNAIENNFSLSFKLLSKPK